MQFRIFLTKTHYFLPIMCDYTTADGWKFNHATKQFFQVFSNNTCNATAAKTYCESKNSNLAAIKSNDESAWQD